MITETQRTRRGHGFAPPADTEVPGLYETESTATADKLIPLHYFCAAGDWWIAELDRETGKAYGYAKLTAHPEGAEWGYIDLAELEAINAHRGLVIVERDLYWQPRKFGDIKEAQR
jgi:hypothetical protein